MIQDWGQVTLSAFQNAWQVFLSFIPALIGAIIIFVIGWFIAIAVGKVVAEILIRIKFNKIFERSGWKEALEKAELKVNPAEFIGAICKWILVIVFLMIAADILKWEGFVILLSKILDWLPNLLVAVAIFVVAVILGDILEKIVKASVKKIKVGYAEFLGVGVRWAIYVFAVLAILLQLGVATSIINTVIMGFIGMLALALGLAFGLGGKEAAAEIIKEIRHKVSER